MLGTKRSIDDVSGELDKGQFGKGQLTADVGAQPAAISTDTIESVICVEQETVSQHTQTPHHRHNAIITTNQHRHAIFTGCGKVAWLPAKLRKRL